MNYSQHNPQWRKDNGKARYNIILCLNQDDKDEVEELRAIAEIDPTEKAYKELSKRIKHLLAALPPAYRSTRSTINA
ncbi:hypothetical protein M433DRAFT_9516 [Acidomyces richmondensis BFW]|nr:hypothetical protein M433DRAFT_9516 [Acidomyces richmondensis BFW]